MLAGWLAFALGTLLLDGVTLPVGMALVLVWLGFGVGLWLLPRPLSPPPAPARPPAWDLPLRAGCALLLVLVLTTIAGWLGPTLSGLLAPFPVITTVLATFTHAQRGPAEAARLLRGMLTGFGAFALFCFILAVSLRATGVAVGFVIASACALLAQGTLIGLAQRGRLAFVGSDHAPPARHPLPEAGHGRDATPLGQAAGAPGQAQVGYAEISTN
jgi:hypothetical protein